MHETKRPFIDSDPLSEKREEKALRNFKQVLKEMLYLLLQSTRSDTASLYWVNKQRGQFVLEASSSRFSNATFQDRVMFENSYLEPYIDLEDAVQLEVGVHVEAEKLTHYYKQVPVRYLNVLPFMNNGETVALTILESNDANVTSDDEESVIAYTNALGNLLYTFLELSDLSKDESQWVQYDDILEQVNSRDDHAVLLDNVMMRLQSFIHKGGVTLLCRGAERWRVVLNTNLARNAPHVGTVLAENTIAYEALRTGKPEFTIHFNSNPRRISPKEPLSQGATLAIPMLLHDRRQAVFLVYDENPLLFKESVKHKMINLVRVASLKMMGAKESYKVSSDFMTHDSGAFSMPLIERTIQREIKRSILYPETHTWVAMLTFEEVNSLRTRFGLDHLKDLQRQVVKRITPDLETVDGVTGFHTDYIYVVILQSEFEDGARRWLHQLEASDTPFSCDNVELELNFRVGFTLIDGERRDAYEITKAIKQAFSEATKSAQFAIEI
jgi:hypothetical protein